MRWIRSVPFALFLTAICFSGFVLAQTPPVPSDQTASLVEQLFQMVQNGQWWAVAALIPLGLMELAHFYGAQAQAKWGRYLTTWWGQAIVGVVSTAGTAVLSALASGHLHTSADGKLLLASVGKMAATALVGALLRNLQPREVAPPTNLVPLPPPANP